MAILESFAALRKPNPIIMEYNGTRFKETRRMKGEKEIVFRQNGYRFDGENIYEVFVKIRSYVDGKKEI